MDHPPVVSPTTRHPHAASGRAPHRTPGYTRTGPLVYRSGQQIAHLARRGEHRDVSPAGARFFLGDAWRDAMAKKVLNARELHRYNFDKEYFGYEHLGIEPHPDSYEDPTAEDFAQYPQEIVEPLRFREDLTRRAFHQAAQDRQHFLQEKAAGRVRFPLTSSALRAAVWEKSAGRCWYCGLLTNPWRTFCIDHLVPWLTGGNALDNLVPCCKRCNARKKSRTAEDFRRELVARGELPEGFWYEHQEQGEDA